VTGHEVVLKNISPVDVVGFGTVKLRLTTAKLMEMGLGAGFSGEGCYVKKGQQIVGNGFVEDDCFGWVSLMNVSGGNQA
ncbi:hypothetical protein Tco_0544512, partial [Tanacetum coccineum]